MNLLFRAARPLILTFVALAVLITNQIIFFNDGKIDYVALMGANCLFFLVSFFIFRMQYLAMQHKNPSVFIRSVMGGMLVKVFVCVIAVVAYYFLSGPAFNKPAVYISMVIYIVYLVVEVRTIMKLNKTKNA
ncbi:MAG: hypothetical protein WBP16_02760 [Ferruginibacter sp.]